eukprot:TRINITY_DN747_c0_g1_i10.p1 TRINITY_DN747_c0_g1~~TRINITY_DN747_c0_g1_i10.p1  ORF type:complete len:457 (+),score=136.25 TRINITY_DN747_c0_g1_i10:121-1371(+)
MRVSILVLSLTVMTALSASIGEDDASERIGRKNCKKPNGKHGAVVVTGCVKWECKKGSWSATQVSPCPVPASKQQLQQLSDTVVGNDNDLDEGIQNLVGGVQNLTILEEENSEDLDKDVQSLVRGIQNLTLLEEENSEDLDKDVQSIVGGLQNLTLLEEEGHDAQVQTLSEISKSNDQVLNSLANLTKMQEDAALEGDFDFDAEAMLDNNKELQGQIENSKCMKCLLIFAPECIPICATGNPTTCLYCIATNAKGCLGLCGFDRIPEADEVHDAQCDQPYTVLSDAWRKIEYGTPHSSYHCDQTGSSSVYTGLTTGWYSFNFNGPATIPTTAPLPENVDGDRKSCGTQAVAWTPSALPNIGEVPLDITINFAWRSNPKYGSTTGKVVACIKDGKQIFLYNLQPVPGCHLAYCAIQM